MTRRARGALGLLLAVMASVGCRASGTGAAPGTAIASDTLRGMVRLVGSEPLATLAVFPATGDPVVPQGADAELLRGLTGIEVVVRGRLTFECASDAGPRGARIFEMASFAVRAVGGVRAVDGILTRVDSGWRLVTPEGEQIAIAFLAPMLRLQEGARVYFVGPFDRAPSTYGIIKAAVR